MLDNKFIFTLVGLIMAVLAICKFNIGNTEPFEFQRTSRILDIRNPLQRAQAAKENYKNKQVTEKYRNRNKNKNKSPRIARRRSRSNSKPRPRSAIKPRVQYNKKRAPKKFVNAHDIANTVENFSPEVTNYLQSSVPKLSGTAVHPTYGPDYGQSNLPVGDMTENENAVIYERAIFANQKNRNRSLGDPIRGDLPIVPNKGCWFTPSADPSTMLMQGGANVLFGASEAGNKMNELIHASSGGLKSNIAGAPVDGSVTIIDKQPWPEIHGIGI